MGEEQEEIETGSFLSTSLTKKIQKPEVADRGGGTKPEVTENGRIRRKQKVSFPLPPKPEVTDRK